MVLGLVLVELKVGLQELLTSLFCFICIHSEVALKCLLKNCLVSKLCLL